VQGLDAVVKYVSPLAIALSSIAEPIIGGILGA